MYVLYNIPEYYAACLRLDIIWYLYDLDRLNIELCQCHPSHNIPPTNFKLVMYNLYN